MKASGRIMVKVGLWALLAVALAMGGCNGRADTQSGPVVQRSTEELIAQINANNALIPDLWCRLDIKVKLPGEKHSISGHLILRKPSRFGQPPRELRLKGGDSLGVAEFELGSNSERYWYTLRAPRNDPVHNSVLHGEEESSGSAKRALDLLSVLGVYELPADMNKQPWPVLQGYKAPAYYIVSFFEQSQTGRLRVLKAVWWHRRKQQVDLIELFDEQGNCYLSAELEDYRQFNGAQLATTIRIFWFEEKLTLELKLRDVKVNSGKVSDKNFVYRKPSWARGD